MAGDVVPVLELQDVTASDLAGLMAAAPLSLRLMPGDLCLIDARDPELAAHFADLCCGLTEPDTGTVRLLGRDWSRTRAEHAAALRSRIGRVFGSGGWVDYLDMASNILLPQLHHTHHDPRALQESASRLAFTLGLPGLPLGQVDELSPADLARSGLVRALLGEPELLVLESPVQGTLSDLTAPLLNLLATARDRGAAAMWLTRSDLVWFDRSFPATERMRLNYRGLASLWHA